MTTTSDDIAALVVEYNTVSEHTSGLWGRTVETVKAIVDGCGVFMTPAEIRANVDGELYAGEAVAVRAKIGDDAWEALPSFRSGAKAGRKKLTAHLCPTYRNARSTILSAIEDGAALVDEDGATVGKTALEKRGKGRTEATPAERVQKYGRLLVRALQDAGLHHTADDVGRLVESSVAAFAEASE